MGPSTVVTTPISTSTENMVGPMNPRLQAMADNPTRKIASRAIPNSASLGWIGLSTDSDFKFDESRAFWKIEEQSKKGEVGL
jgi:hypothetical protein